MNQKLEQFFTEHGFKKSENSHTAKSGSKIYGFALFNGEINHYEANINIMDKAYFHLTCFIPEASKALIKQHIENNKFKFFAFQFTPFGFSFSVNDWTINKLLKRLEFVMDTIGAILEQDGALGIGYCPITGLPLTEENTIVHTIGYQSITMSKEGLEQFNQGIEEENQKFDEAPNNYLKGLGGSLVGAIAGVALNVVLFLAGFISMWSGILGVLLAAFLYKKFGGKPTKLMPVIASVPSLILIPLSTFVLYIITANGMAVEANLTVRGMAAFNYAMSNSAEFKAAFAKDFSMTIVFTLIAGVLSFIQLFASTKRPSKI